VLAEFERDQSESGATVEEVAARLNASAEAVKVDVQFFCEEGHLYSTVDDDHFKSMSSCILFVLLILCLSVLSSIGTNAQS
jgi:hypothetical protein